MRANDMAQISRNTSIDGLRVLLAMLVVFVHYFDYVGSNLPIGFLPVDCFFVMSGYVLTPGWRGNHGEFLIRRVLRLWPVYAFALAVASLLYGCVLPWTAYAFFPLEPGELV